ncbi:noncompact myelin-associated protein [Trichomycterus rosablanca]|uniref:noncompact myelin-associated protein n=1 Tax=Trichomycterus rosablanca TaxID=2290929 RepID=UPI002F357963
MAPTKAPTTTVSTTKSKQQILIQSSGAMIAIIVIGIIIILAILLIILKTYNRRTHTSRVLGKNTSKPRTAINSTSTMQTNLQMSNLRGSNGAGDFGRWSDTSENTFRIPRAELPNREPNLQEELNSSPQVNGSTVVTIHTTPTTIGNT